MTYSTLPLPPALEEPKQPDPTAWKKTELGSVLKVIRGVTYKSAEARHSGAGGFLPILRATNIGRELDFDSMVYVPKNRVSDEQLLHSGDIVIAASSGSRAVVGKAALLKQEFSGSFGAFCFALRPNEEVDARFLAYYLQTSEYRNRVSTLSAGVNINNLRRAHIENLPFSYPPLDEQDAIVAEIETQFARLDDAVAALVRARTRLQRYRASVLKAACEGMLVLTEAELARQEGRDYEPASVLLERIRAEREADPGQKRGKAKKAQPLDASNLPELPNGWEWTTLSSFADIKGGITKGQKRKPGEVLREVPYLRVANVQRGYLDLSEIKAIEAPEDKIQELLLKPGDVLFNEGGDRDKLGRGWVWQGELLECIHQNHVFRARLIDCGIQAKFVSWYGNTFGQQYFLEQGKQTTNLASINLSKLSALPVPLPPADEQKRITAEVERKLSMVDQLDATVEKNLRRAEGLRQSILHKAFRGRLVSNYLATEAN